MLKPLGTIHVGNNIMLLRSLLKKSEHDVHNLGWPSNHCMSTQELLNQSYNDKQGSLYVGCNHMAAEQAASDDHHHIACMPCTHDFKNTCSCNSKIEAPSDTANTACTAQFVQVGKQLKA